MLRKLFQALLLSIALFSTAFAAVDLNTASLNELESIKGIGPAKAKAILDHRIKNGHFKTTSDIMKVPGIKEATYNKIKAEITVGPLPGSKAAKK